MERDQPPTLLHLNLNVNVNINITASNSNNGSLLPAVSAHLPSMHLSSVSAMSPSVSLASPRGTHGSSGSQGWALVGLLLMVLLNTVALLANAAVLAVVVRVSHLRKRLVYVGHLCAVDLLCATLLMPLGVASDSPLFSSASVGGANGGVVGGGGGASVLSFSPLACRLYVGLHATLVAASIFSVTAISVERYYYIVHPMRYEARMTPRLAAAILALLWVVSLVLGCATILGWPLAAHTQPQEQQPQDQHLHLQGQEQEALQLQIQLEQYGSSSSSSSSSAAVFCCSLRWGRGRHCWGFSLLFASLCFCVPATVILAVYGNVYKVARVAARQQNCPVPSWACNNNPPSTTINTTTTTTAAVAGVVNTTCPSKCHSHTDNHHHHHHHHHHRRTLLGGKAAVTLAVIVGQFLLCWLPYFAFHLRLSLAPPQHSVAAAGSGAVALVNWLAYSSFAANPFFYGLLNRQIREELGKMLCCCRRHQPHHGGLAAVRPVRTEGGDHEGITGAQHDHDHHDHHHYYTDFLHFLHHHRHYPEAIPSNGNSAFTPRTTLDQSGVRIPGQIPEELV